MFKFLIKTGVAAEAEFKELLADAKKGIVDWAGYLLKISDKLDERTIKAFEELHAAIEAEEIKLQPAPEAPLGGMTGTEAEAAEPAPEAALEAQSEGTATEPESESAPEPAPAPEEA